MNKLTDYAMMILLELNSTEVFSARHLSEKTKIPLATTNKILKLLAKSQLCESKNGKNGGFYLKKLNISVLDVLNSMEENGTQLTECISHDKGCQLSSHCKISKKMRKLNDDLSAILNSYLISDFK